MSRTLLSINASPRTGERSLSRRLGNRFIENWRRLHPDGRVVGRDLRDAPPSFIQNSWIAAAFLPPEARSYADHSVLGESDRLVDEFLAADEYVIATPIYNFSMPAVLKAYVDQIVRIGRTFEMAIGGESPYRGMVPPGRSMTVLVATGDAGYESGGVNYAYNFLEPHLRTVFALVGVVDLAFIYAGHDEAGDDARDRSLAAAIQQVDGKMEQHV